MRPRGGASQANTTIPIQNVKINYMNKTNKVISDLSPRLVGCAFESFKREFE